MKASVLFRRVVAKTSLRTSARVEKNSAACPVAEHLPQTPYQGARHSFGLLWILPCVTLAACASLPPHKPEPALIAYIPEVVVTTGTNDIDDLLGYHQSLRQKSQAELAAELGKLHLQSSSPRISLQQAMVLSMLRGNGDLIRAQAQLDSVLSSTESEAQSLKPLARLLADQYAELWRLTEQVDKLGQQGKENQRRIDQLNKMLEGLKAIERTLPAGNGAAPSNVPVK